MQYLKIALNVIVVYLLIHVCIYFLKDVNSEKFIQLIKGTAVMSSVIHQQNTVKLMTYNSS